MLSVTLLPRCCRTRERWKDVVERTHNQLHLQIPSSCSPPCSLLSKSEPTCNISAIKTFKNLPEVQLSDETQWKYIRYNVSTAPLPWHPWMRGVRGQEQSSAMSTFLLTYPIFPTSRTGCNFCTGLSTKQTQLKNIHLPSRIWLNEAWFSTHLFICKLLSVTLSPCPKTKFTPSSTTHASLSHISNNA